MSNYIPNKQKKNKIFHKRETVLKHAIKHKLESEKIEAAVARLRESKLAAIQAQYAETRSPERGRLRKKWETMTSDEIIAKYSKGLES